MAVAVLRHNTRLAPRQRPSARARYEPFFFTRAQLSFSITGDVTALFTVEGVAPSSLAGGSSGRARVRPAPRQQMLVRPRS